MQVVKASLLDGALEAMEEGGAGSSEWKDATALGGEEDEEQQPTTQPLQGPTTSAAVSSLTNVSTSVEAVLVGSEAHLRLAEACAQQLLPHYRRLTDSYGRCDVTDCWGCLPAVQAGGVRAADEVVRLFLSSVMHVHLMTD